jgi:hypothetical protein
MVLAGLAVLAVALAIPLARGYTREEPGGVGADAGPAQAPAAGAAPTVDPISDSAPRASDPVPAPPPDAGAGESNPPARTGATAAETEGDAAERAPDAAPETRPGAALADSVPGRGGARGAFPRAGLIPLRAFLTSFARELSSRPAREVLSEFYPDAPQPRTRGFLQMREAQGNVQFRLGAVEPQGVAGDTTELRFVLIATAGGRGEVRLGFDARVVPTANGLRFADLRRNASGGPGR